VLSELTERGIPWLTLRERGPKLIAELAALPDSEWKTVRVERSGRVSVLPCKLTVLV